MDRYKTSEATRRLAKAILSSGDLGRPFIAPPGMAPDRVKTLRDAFMKTVNDPALLAEAEKRRWEAKPVSGERLEALARDVIAQPPEVISRMKEVLGR
jgi:tripartite-type tricarboxylate transporter receptor subunit TctC